MITCYCKDILVTMGMSLFLFRVVECFSMLSFWSYMFLCIMNILAGYCYYVYCVREAENE